MALMGRKNGQQDMDQPASILKEFREHIMPKVKHFECVKCGEKRTSPDGKGMPAQWTEIKIRETTGGGLSGLGRRLWGNMAQALFCNVCWPTDYRVAHQRDVAIKRILLGLK